MTLLAPTLQAFFTERLMTQQNASRHTVASYRDCLRLLVCFARTATGAQPSHLTIEQVNATLVGAFLDHLEHDRGVSIATRNARLAAVHSLFRFAALRHPEHAELISRVLAIPVKRAERAIVAFLTAEEADALLAAPDLSRRACPARPRPAGAGRPDRAAGLGDHRAARRRRAPGRRPARPVHREGPQGPRHAADPPDRRYHARLARRARRRLRRPGLPRPGRQAAGHRRRSAGSPSGTPPRQQPAASLYRTRRSARIR